MATRLSGAPLPPLFFDEDDDFGEFEFASAPQPPPPQPPPAYVDFFRTAAPLHPMASVPNTEGGGGDDGDEWGDFMESPLSLDMPTPVSPSPSHPQPFPDLAAARSEVNAPKASKGWEKPIGAIPLSIFGEEEGEVEEPDLGGGSALPGAKDLFFPSASKPTKVGSVGVGIQDLLADLYGQAEANKPGGDGDGEKVSNGTAEVGADDVGGHSDQDDGFDSGWEFKAAVPDAGLADLMSGQQKDIGDLFSRPGFSTNGILFQNDKNSGSFGDVTESNGSDNSMDPSIINGHANSNEKKFEVKDPVLGSKDLPKNIDFFGLQDTGPILNGKYQELDDLWGNHMEELSTSNANDMKQESSDNIEPTSRSTRLNGVLSNNKTNFSDLLSGLYEETSKSEVMEKISPRNINDSANAVIDSLDMDAQLFHDNNWYPRDASSENLMQDETFLHTETHEITQTGAEKQKRLVSFYSDLKQVTYSVALHHLENHKKAYEHAAHSGEELKAMELYQEIQEASAKLQVRSEDIENAAKDINFEGISLSDLLENLKHPQFQTLDWEFSLSKRIALAEKEMGTASDLYEHALSTLYILYSASLDGQHKYFMAWSKMLLACLQELQHGANIWTECVHANICPQIISEPRGCEFLLALGEIYRVSKILQLSLKVFKHWVLLSTTEGDPFDCCDRCSKFWINSGLHKALEDVPEQMHIKENIKMLLESTKTIDDLSARSLQNRVPSHVGPVCQLSLLPLGILPDMKDVVWDGKSYYLKLANLWANRVSCDPPNLPPWKVG